MTSFIPPEYNQLLLKIHELTIRNEKVTFSKLISEGFEHEKTCPALIYLCKSGIVADIWDKPAGEWVQRFEIEIQYIPFVEKLRDQL
jgi:hypothetical protein